MKKNHPPRAILVEMIIIAWALLATAAYFVQKATVNYTFDYSFLSRPVYESRFEGPAQMLPALSKAFYIADPVADRSSEEVLNRELLAHYCLTPFLTTDAGAPFQVADFHHPVDLHQWSKDHDLELIRDFQGGVALFAKKGIP
jgi:hypothetical protein